MGHCSQGKNKKKLGPLMLKWLKPHWLLATIFGRNKCLRVIYSQSRGIRRLPAEVIERAEAKAKEKGKRAISLGLIFRYMPVMKFAKNRSLRKMWLASGQEPHKKWTDNTELIKTIVSLRQKRARFRLCHPCRFYPWQRMAKSTQTVWIF